MRGLAVGDVMTRNFISVEPEDSILDCAKTLIKNRGINSLLVTHNKKLIGIKMPPNSYSPGPAITNC